MSPLDLDAIVNSRFGLSVAVGIGRATPTVLGYRMAAAAADFISSRRGSDVVRAVRSNRWVVSGGELLGEDLDEAVRTSFRVAGRFLYDLYHFFEDTDALEARVSLSDEAQRLLVRGGPAVCVAPHMGNFDFSMRALALRGFRALALGVPQPTDAYRAQNEMRSRAGLEVAPISISALRRADARLDAGGFVLTGLDRPLSDRGRTLRFFGRTAQLPDVHVRLALRKNVPLIFIHVFMDDDGIYRIDAGETVLVRESGGTKAERGKRPGRDIIRENAESVLALTERVIAAHPDQWTMPHAVWPEAMAELESIEGVANRRDE